MRIINAVIYLILMKNIRGDLPPLKIFLNDVIWCLLQYILSKFQYNICRKRQRYSEKHLMFGHLLPKLGGGMDILSHTC